MTTPPLQLLLVLISQLAPVNLPASICDLSPPLCCISSPASIPPSGGRLALRVPSFALPCPLSYLQCGSVVWLDAPATVSIHTATVIQHERSLSSSSIVSQGSSGGGYTFSRGAREVRRKTQLAWARRVDLTALAKTVISRQYVHPIHRLRA